MLISLSYQNGKKATTDLLPDLQTELVLLGMLISLPYHKGTESYHRLTSRSSNKPARAPIVPEAAG